jgi:hypothetical protein
MKPSASALLATLAVLAVTLSAATTATALPSILFLSGVTSGVLEGSATANSKFFGIRNLEASGYLFKFEAAADMVSLGKAKLLFTGVGFNNGGTIEKCNTEGDGAGLVLIDNAEWHLVLNLASEPRLLVLIPEFLLICGTLHIKVRGSQLNSFSPYAKEVLETESFTGSTGVCSGTGSKTPAFTEYVNDSNEMITAKLESSVGAGFSQSCEEITGNISLKPSKMVEVMN